MDAPSVIALTYHDDLKEVQGDRQLRALIDGQAATPFDRTDWWSGLAQDCGLAPLLAVARQGDQALVLPLARGSGRGHLGALANWYTFRVAPVATPGADRQALLSALARGLARRAGRIELAPLPDENGEASAIASAFRAAGWWVRRQECDTNHVLNLNGRDYAAYLAGRPGPLRTTLKRKGKKALCTVHTHWSDAAWADYEAVYAASWKTAEGSPAFLARFARQEAAAGRLRLGIARAADNPQGPAIAAQLWTIEGGTAFIHKLAYDEAAKPLSPGTSLSAALFAHVIDVDHVASVDFGTGDDPYKRDWMEEQRPRYRLDMIRLDRPGQWPRLMGLAMRALARRLRDGVARP